MAMQVGGALNPFPGDAGTGLKPDRDTPRRKETLPAQLNADAQSAGPSSAKGPQAEDEFVRSGETTEPQDEEKRAGGTTKDRKKAEEDAAKEAADARKRKPRAEISVLYAEDVPDPSDPRNPNKKRTVYRRGPTYPAPEFGLGGNFNGIF